MRREAIRNYALAAATLSAVDLLEQTMSLPDRLILFLTPIVVIVMMGRLVQLTSAGGNTNG